MASQFSPSDFDLVFAFRHSNGSLLKYNKKIYCRGCALVIFHVIVIPLDIFPSKDY